MYPSWQEHVIDKKYVDCLKADLHGKIVQSDRSSWRTRFTNERIATLFS